MKTICCMMACVFVYTAPVSAKSKMRMGVKLVLDVAGEGELEIGSNEEEGDLEPTLGVALFGTHQIWKYIHVGMLVGMGWVQTDSMDDENIDRNFYMDLSPMIMGTYPLLQGALELYAMLPIGLTFCIVSDELEDSLFGANIDTGLGWNVGLLFGASYRIVPHLRLMLEMGWQGRGASHDVNPGSFDLDWSMHQLAMRVGAVWEF